MHIALSNRVYKSMGVAHPSDAESRTSQAYEENRPNKRPRPTVEHTHLLSLLRADSVLPSCTTPDDAAIAAAGDGSRLLDRAMC